MIDVCEREDEIVIFVEMPGVDKSDVQLSWNHGVLTISGQKRQHLPGNRSPATCVSSVRTGSSGAKSRSMSPSTRDTQKRNLQTIGLTEHIHLSESPKLGARRIPILWTPA